MRRARILVTGAQGQIGFELARLLLPHGDVVATDRATLDLADWVKAFKLIEERTVVGKAVLVP